ncbi:MAG: chorismate lyase [Gammaproteobacteria bacterium]|nr:chorismate lyase [Gammaproteobacteria bacterium]
MRQITTRHRDGRWREPACLPRGEIPSDIACWLLDRGSLTRRLQLSCDGRFSVEVLAQSWQRPLLEEARLLGLRPEQWVLVREVRLLCDGTPWVYARTVMPRLTLTGRHRTLARLGTRPLGAVLFADPTMRRGPMQVSRLLPGQRLYAKVERAGNCQGREVWGRRSVFHLADKPLLVYEMFLPQIGPCRG